VWCWDVWCEPGKPNKSLDRRSFSELYSQDLNGWYIVAAPGQLKRIRRQYHGATNPTHGQKYYDLGTTVERGSNVSMRVGPGSNLCELKRSEKGRVRHCIREGDG